MQNTCYIVTILYIVVVGMMMKCGVYTSCLIMQHKPYIVELSFMEIQKSNDSRTISNHGGTIPVQCGHDVTHRNHQTEFKSDFKLYTPYPCHLFRSLALLHLL